MNESLVLARAAKADKFLDSKVRYNGVEQTWREIAHAALKAGKVIVIENVEDTALINKLTKQLERLKNRPFGNECHPETIKYESVKIQLKAGPTKTEYRLANSDADTFLIVNKTFMEYYKDIGGNKV